MISKADKLRLHARQPFKNGTETILDKKNSKLPKNQLI
jgi:hypothetical protein